MVISYKYIDKPRTFDEGADCLEHEIYPLLQKFWKVRGETFYKKPLQFNTLAFVNLWVQNGLALVIAYDDKKPVGLFIGITFTPMLFSENVMQVETLYGDTPEIEQGLYDYVASITPILGIDAIHMQGDMNDTRLVPQGWVRSGSYDVACFHKG